MRSDHVRPPVPFTVAHVSFNPRPPDDNPHRLLDTWWSLRDVAQAVARTGLRCSVFQTFGADESLQLDDVEYRFVRDRSARRWFARPLSAFLGPRRLLGALAAERPQVVHVHGLVFPLQIAQLCSRVPGAAVVVQDHASRPPQGWRRLVYRRALGRISGVAFTARQQALPFIENRVLRPDIPVFEIPEGTSRFSPGDVNAARSAMGLYGDPCLVWLGNLDRNKDPLTVLDALSGARGALPDPHLWCCFRAAPLLDQVRRRIERDPALAGRVHLLGAKPHDEVEQVLRGADFFIQGSHREGSGYALIEALACGTPGIVTDIPPFRCLTGDGRVAALSPPGDAQAMAAAIVTWSRQDRTAQRQAARAHFEQTLSLDAIGWAWRRAYETLLKERGA